MAPLPRLPDPLRDRPMPLLEDPVRDRRPRSGSVDVAPGLLVIAWWPLLGGVGWRRPGEGGSVLPRPSLPLGGRVSESAVRGEGETIPAAPDNRLELPAPLLPWRTGGPRGGRCGGGPGPIPAAAAVGGLGPTGARSPLSPLFEAATDAYESGKQRLYGSILLDLGMGQRGRQGHKERRSGVIILLPDSPGCL